ncbi:MAG: hypothetical protein V1906_03660 [Candidatus Woesearchaeota archaeon]
MKHEILGQRRERKYRFVKDIGKLIEEDTRRLEREGKLPKYEEAGHETVTLEEARPFVASGSGYDLMNIANTYALGVHALRKACKGNPNCAHPAFVKKHLILRSIIHRPLTFEENIRARLDDYNTLHNPDGSDRGEKERLRLFNTSLDSCTGVAYKKGTPLFKIITESEDLIHIGKGFNDIYLPVDYSKLRGVELDRSQGKYNQLLTLKDAINHPAWNEAVTDKPLLNEYANLIFRLKIENNMGFWVRQNASQDELRALYVDNLNNNSSADGYYSLDNGGRFVRATHAAH